MHIYKILHHCIYINIYKKTRKIINKIKLNEITKRNKKTELMLDD